MNRPKQPLSSHKPISLSQNTSSTATTGATSISQPINSLSLNSSANSELKQRQQAAMDRSMRERLDLLENSGPIKKPIEKENFQTSSVSSSSSSNPPSSSASNSNDNMGTKKLKPSMLDKQKEIEKNELESCKR
jgi:hypothetical protein